MKLLFVADGRSPIADNWIAYFVRAGHEVHLVSTFPCDPSRQFASFHWLPVAFSSAKVGSSAIAGKTQHRRLLWSGSAVRFRTAVRQWLGPLTLPSAARKLRRIIQAIEPDLVHAMRIPFEGMVSALAEPSRPLILSVWGNDFTLHAPSHPWMVRLTRRALDRADALHVDCQRDLRLARAWGCSGSKPAVVLPGAGGIQIDTFFPDPPGPEINSKAKSPVIVNPRGFRAYVCNDTFFRAIPGVLSKCPEARFLCPAMAGESQAERWVDSLGLQQAVELLPKIPREEMADLFRRSQITVSLTTHDGTPNSLLEAMACGSFPIAGDLESVREWILPGVNGLLVDPIDPQAVSSAILQALALQDLRRSAREHNVRLIGDRAEYSRVMQSAERFYQEILG